ncbi:MAG: penicillin acylase family protein, partial [Polyangiaceae bacterium]|nr:penicillin acylase family protein [Polyangiaceae bacterium]
VEQHFAYGRQNWVFGDLDGNIGWTQASRLPIRPAGSKPWLVLPGEDGSAEWQGYVEPKKIPNALNPAKNYLVTANADPIGVTADNQPTEAQAPAGGYPLYLSADYDPGTRVSRITQRITAATAGGGKLDPDSMAAIQADAITEFGGVLQPYFVAAARALAEYVAAPASHPEFDGEAGAGVVSDKAEVRAFYETAQKLVAAWTLDTPSGFEPGITQASIDDSRAMLLVTAFSRRLAELAIGDEAKALSDAEKGLVVPFAGASGTRLLPRLLQQPEDLQTGEILFDNLTTPAVETREIILARAVTEAIDWALTAPALGPDPSTWRWGSVHTVKPAFFLPLPFLDQPDAYPRHGGAGTVDVADPGFSDDNYTFRSGAAIRFVCELDPVKGPVARNVVPGGQIFDEASPHYNDQLKLWAQNKALNLPFKIEEVVERAKQEQATNQLGRLRFQPR